MKKHVAEVLGGITDNRQLFLCSPAFCFSQVFRVLLLASKPLHMQFPSKWFSSFHLITKAPRVLQKLPCSSMALARAILMELCFCALPLFIPTDSIHSSEALFHHQEYELPEGREHVSLDVSPCFWTMD